MMKRVVLGLFGAILWAVPAGWAQYPYNQNQYNNGRAGAPAYIPYGLPLQVPPAGCVWDNVIYSNGAVIERQNPVTTVYQCVRGSWKIIRPGELLEPGSAEGG
jgi:hypothetical protein